MKSKFLLVALLGAVSAAVSAGELDNSSRAETSNPAGVLVKFDDKGQVLEAYKVEGNAKAVNDEEAKAIIASAATDANKIQIQQQSELDKSSSTAAWWWGGWGGGCGWGFGIGYGYGWGGWGGFYRPYYYYPGYYYGGYGYGWGLWW